MLMKSLFNTSICFTYINFIINIVCDFINIRHRIPPVYIYIISQIGYKIKFSQFNNTQSKILKMDRVAGFEPANA